MVHRFQVTVDAADPPALGRFWCEVLGYIEQPPPEGYDDWETFLTEAGIDISDPDRAFAIVPPDMDGPRMFFLRVPEGKTAKNRFHLDVAKGDGVTLRDRADQLIALGATEVGVFDEPEGSWITLLDPEGNEFCIH